MGGPIGSTIECGRGCQGFCKEENLADAMDKYRYWAVGSGSSCKDLGTSPRDFGVPSNSFDCSFVPLAWPLLTDGGVIVSSVHGLPCSISGSSFLRTLSTVTLCGCVAASRWVGGWWVGVVVITGAAVAAAAGVAVAVAEWFWSQWWLWYQQQ